MKSFHILLEESGSMRENRIRVLVWAGVELIFFVVIGMMLCFGLRMRTMLITHRCFSYLRAVLAQSQGFSCSWCCLANEEAGGAPGAGMGRGQDSWPRMPNGMSHTV